MMYSLLMTILQSDTCRWCSNTFTVANSVEKNVSAWREWQHTDSYEWIFMKVLWMFKIMERILSMQKKHTIHKVVFIYRWIIKKYMLGIKTENIVYTSKWSTCYLSVTSLFQTINCTMDVLLWCLEWEFMLLVNCCVY